METAKTFWLTNGLVVRIEDGSVSDDSTSCTVKLIIRCTIAMKAEYVADFEERPIHQEIMKLLAPATEYRREIIKTGVSRENAETEKAKIMDAFEKEALPYLQVQDFPARYVRKLYTQLEKELSARGS